ncbi:PLP-dependent aminotransferase family protein [Propionibacterium sp. NM47_B9-13]|nr:PLP-dependent aminotransferase family protein [Cutibacterium modestum]MCP2376398.1 transcriptional regulator [Cutibacterium modestum 28N]TGY29463.1 PLP-dependent aminotransferase family protein [Propionibacterium sp. NM47_B9-13]
MRPDLVVDLPLRLPNDPRPLPVRICEGIRGLVMDGVLAPGDHLPSTRVLSTQLRVSRGSVVASYEQLEAEGYLVAAAGSGTQVNPDLRGLHRRSTTTAAAPRAQHYQGIDLTPGAPDTAGLANSAWRSAWHRACVNPPRITDPLGSPGLREEIAEHLRQMRSLLADPRQVVVTGGARAGLAELIQVLCNGSHRLTIGVESPGYPSLRRVPTALGHRIAGLPTDNQGLDPASLPTGHGGKRLDAVLVTPSHQYPWGGSLSASRRAAVIEWAEKVSCWIVEDDFDSELRHVGAPLPALASLDEKHTILLGTFSSLLTPALGCGYLVVPPALVHSFAQQRRATGQPVPAIVQEAVAGYLSTGALRRRTQRMRQVYRRRRRTVIDVLGSLPGTTLQPIDGGLHAVLVFNGSEEDVVQRCRQEGVGVTPLSTYWGSNDAEAAGIVLGFGSHNDSTLVCALKIIASAVTEHSRTPPR